MNININIHGATQTAMTFARLRGGIQRRVLRRSVTSGAAPIRRAAKATSRFQDRTGLLRRSLVVKTKTYSSDGRVVAVIGSNRSVQGTHKGKKIVPANYAHLVELGHRGPGGSQVMPRPFLESSLSSSSSAAIRAFAKTFSAAVASEALKAKP